MIYYEKSVSVISQTRSSRSIVHMDEFIDDILREERVCDIMLPRIQKRHVLEENEQLEQKRSALEDDLEDLESEEEDEDMRIPSPPRRRSISPDRRRRRSRSRSKSPTRRRRSRSRSRSNSPRRTRRSPSPPR